MVRRRSTLLLLALLLACSACTSAIPTMGPDPDGEEEGVDVEDLTDGDDMLEDGAGVSKRDIERERAYFMEKDADGDGLLSTGEFLEQLRAVMTDHGDVGLTHMGIDDAEFAMREFDMNEDGHVSWGEWESKMFHEAPQQPQYRDGEGGGGGDTDDPDHMMRVFKEWDQDKDGYLDGQGELKAMLMSHGAAVAGGEGEGLSEDEVKMLLWHVLDDKDTDKDGRLTLDEWQLGGGY